MAPPTLRKTLCRAGLFATILVGPLLTGGWRLEVLPVIGGFAAVAYLGALSRLHQKRRALVVPPLALGLLVLFVLTALQAMPWPGDLVAILSPKVAEVRAFAVNDAAGPLSYEPSATWREAAKLLLYFIVVVTVAALVRTERENAVGLTARPIAIAGLASLGIAFVHRIAGLQDLYGLLDTHRAGGPMWTTFLNQNHAAGFLNLSGAAAVAVALRTKSRLRRAGWALAATVLLGASLAMGSKGGWVALAVGAAVFVATGFFRAWSGAEAASDRRRRRSSSRKPVRPSLTGWAVAGVIVLGAAVTLFAAMVQTPASRLGLTEKLAAVRDVAGLLDDHPWFGIGRGAYVSVYTLYQTSQLQLTFAFPENIAVQLAAEWGYIMGPIALVGLCVVVIDRWWRTVSTAEQALLAGATAVVVQNFVDFSLELAGVAVAVLAILAATTMRGPIRVERPALVAFIAAAPIVGFTVCLAFAGLAGDLDRDLARLRTSGPDARPESAELARIVERHPASAVVSAQIAFLHETSTPADLRAALKAANRTLYLAPNYADGYLIAGRLLVRAHRRRQGFEMLRKAWRLSSARQIPMISEIASLARRPDELLLAVPRRNPALDVIDEVALVRCVDVVQAKHPGWVPVLFARLPGPEDAPREHWPRVIRTALTAYQTALGLAWVGHWRRFEVTAENTLLLARLLVQADRLSEATATLAEHRGPVNESLLRLRFRLAMKGGDATAGRAVLEQLANVLKPTRDARAEMASMKAQLHIRALEYPAALAALNEALEHVPSRPETRLARARLLLRLQRHDEAKHDIEYVLLRWPDNHAAKALASAAQR